jgi:hypothetical protein
MLSKAEDRLDGMIAMKDLKESAERIHSQSRDLDRGLIYWLVLIRAAPRQY